MRHRLGTLLLVIGLGVLAWAATVYLWKDPFTTAYTAYEQRRLASNLDRAVRELEAGAASPSSRSPGKPKPKPRDDVSREARRFRLASDDGDAIARLRVPRLGLSLVVVNGTSAGDLRRGPGRHWRRSCRARASSSTSPVIARRTARRSRTSTSSRPATRSSVELPYGSVEYRVTSHRIVDDNDLSVLESQRSRGARPPGVPPAVLREPALPRVRAARLGGAHAARFPPWATAGRASQLDEIEPIAVVDGHAPVAARPANARHRSVRDQRLRRAECRRRRRRGAHGALARARGGVRRARRPGDVHARRRDARRACRDHRLHPRPGGGAARARRGAGDVGARRRRAARRGVRAVALGGLLRGRAPSHGRRLRGVSSPSSRTLSRAAPITRRRCTTSRAPRRSPDAPTTRSRTCAARSSSIPSSAETRRGRGLRVALRERPDWPLG